MEIAAGLIKLKPNSSEQFKDWHFTLSNRRDEAIKTLKDEGVEVESWFELEIAGEPYLMWYMRAESIEKVWEVFKHSERELDQFHIEKMTAMSASNIASSPLLDFSANEFKK